MRGKQSNPNENDFRFLPKSQGSQRKKIWKQNVILKLLLKRTQLIYHVIEL